jgi:hypothetical protein
MIKFELWPAVDLTISIAIAFILATLIGAERQYRQRSAGLRTIVLVAVEAATFVSLGFRINGSAGASQIAAYVVSGIGFLGAGAIMKESSKVCPFSQMASPQRAQVIELERASSQKRSQILTEVVPIRQNSHRKRDRFFFLR